MVQPDEFNFAGGRAPRTRARRPVTAVPTLPPSVPHTPIVSSSVLAPTPLPSVPFAPAPAPAPQPLSTIESTQLDFEPTALAPSVPSTSTSGLGTSMTLDELRAPMHQEVQLDELGWNPDSTSGHSGQIRGMVVDADRGHGQGDAGADADDAEINV